MNNKESIFNKELSLGSSRFKDEQKAVLYATLSTLINSGLELLQALEVAKEEQKKKAQKHTIQEFMDEIVQGSTLNQCLMNHTDFSSYEAYSMQIGEETGKLGFILTQLARYFDQRVKQRRQLIGALTYPAVVFVFSILAIFFMVTYVVPMFSNVFQRFGGDLPTITGYIISVSNTVSGNLGVIGLGGITVFILLRMAMRQKRIKQKWQSMQLRIPVIGSLIKDSYLMRWCSAMHLMTASDISIIRSLEITAQMFDFHPLQQALNDASKQIEKGSLLNEVMKNYPIFSKRITSLVGIGEEVNQLDQMFLKLSQNLEKEVAHKSKQIATVVEPIIILFLGGMVAFILVAMYLPMFKLGDGIG